MFVVSENFARIMDFEAEFSRYAEAAGIRNPFKVQIAQFAKGCHRDKNGDLIYDTKKEVPTNAPTKEERENYHRAQDEYVARRCFEELGYEVFLTRTGERVKYLRDELEFVPCKSADGQCSFYCPNYFNCVTGGNDR
jgi:hypothetical protein